MNRLLTQIQFFSGIASVVVLFGSASVALWDFMVVQGNSETFLPVWGTLIAVSLLAGLWKLDFQDKTPPSDETPSVTPT